MWQIKRLFHSSSKQPSVVFILGGPCSGKGTQSQLISNKLNYLHLSAGQLLRQQRNNPKSEHGQLIENTIISGKIVPSFITVSLLRKSMEVNRFRYNKFLIDGFPRNLQNLQKWNSDMSNITRTPFIIFLTCSQKTMLKRLQKRSKTSTRSDDNVEVMRKRFKTFEEQTLPVVQWFRKTDRVIQVSAEGTVQQIFNSLTSQILKFQSKNN